MHDPFTPGAQRALAAAAQWDCGVESLELGPVQLLLGLLDEPECRAAIVLAEHGLEDAAVQRRWPSLKKVAGGRAALPQFSPLLTRALRAAEVRLFDLPQPLELATEHLLLGLA